MLVVGLLSGGKDSVYNLLHCVINGHEPVALASLGPPQGKDELDSYMYQTVGHSGLASIATALELPLFTHTISGQPLNLESHYGSREGTHAAVKGKAKGTTGDETEDLMALLSKVKAAMPEVTGVACGAILSNYQRVRVEHVCSRLGLTPIAYLWERDQKDLLGEMVAAEMESVLVKVAGAGLKVDHLGKSLQQMEPILHKLNAQYELHICGEGGEYETFTVDCPLFKQRINFDKVTTVVSNSDPFSTVAHLHLDECSLAPKPGHPANETFAEMRERVRALVGVPPLLSDEAEEARAAIEGEYGRGRRPLGLAPVVHPDVRQAAWVQPAAKRTGDWLSFAEVTAFGGENPREGLTLDEEVKACFKNLEDLLAQHSATLLDLSHLTVYLSPLSISLFPAINAIYATYFGSAPPTRACVAVLLPSEHLRLKLDGTAHLAPAALRKSLHVQSLSYWAAANIGPYSQVIAVGDRAFVAGQIALVPRSLSLPEPFDFAAESALSLQHVGRVVEAAREKRWSGWGEGGVCWLADVAEDEEWASRMVAAEVGWKHFTTTHDQPYMPMLYVSAASLPKAASIEWQVTYTTLNPPAPHGETDSEDEDAPSKPVLGTEVGRKRLDPADASVWMVSTSRGVARTVNAFYVCAMDGRAPAGLAGLGAVHSIRAFHLAGVEAGRVRALAGRLFGEAAGPVSTVAVARLGVGKEVELGRHEVGFWLVVGTA